MKEENDMKGKRTLGIAIKKIAITIGVTLLSLSFSSEKTVLFESETNIYENNSSTTENTVSN